MKPVIAHPGELVALLDIPFTDEQMEAIVAPLEPAVVVAGAGSGKTAVMAARVVWLVGTGAVEPDEVLGLTFTNKAAGELAHRVREALLRAGLRGEDEDEPVGEPTVSTYHAFAGRLIQEHGLRIGVEPQTRLLTDATRYQLAARVIRTAEGPFHSLSKPVAMLTGDLVALDGELSEHMVDTAELRDHDRSLVRYIESLDEPTAPVLAVAESARTRIELSTLVDAYRAEKRDRDLLDFGDQVALAATLAETRPEVGQIERGRYQVVLLDEYQDTSVAQRRLLTGLFGAGHPVTAVGDPCQAIYGWRGASVANLDAFPAQFPRRDGAPTRRYALSENRRSGGRLIAFANELSAPLRQRHEGVVPLRPRAEADGQGRLRCTLLPTYEDEVAWVGDRVHELVEAGTPPGEIAVLVRAGADFPALHAALADHGLPVEVVGLGGLLHVPEVADLVAVLEVLDDPTANAALVRVLAGPRWRIGPRDLALLGRQAVDLVRPAADEVDQDDPDAALERAVAGVDPVEVVSLSDALAAPGDEIPYSPEARERFAKVAAEIRGLRRHLDEPLLDVIHRVVAVTGLEVELAADPRTATTQRRESLAAFLNVAASFVDIDGDPSLGAFLAFLRAAERHERGLDHVTPSGADSVKLLTVHRAKGLEWDAVVVPALSDGVFPSAQPRERWTSNGRVLPHSLRGDGDSLPQITEWSRKGLAELTAGMREQSTVEESRLGYVAFTRARSILLASGHWWGPAQKRPRGPSCFLEEVRRYCEAGNGTVDTWAPGPEDDATNPLLERGPSMVWPVSLDPRGLVARRRAAEMVRSAGGSLIASQGIDGLAAFDGVADGPDGLSLDERRLIASWDTDLAALLEELRQSRGPERPVVLPGSLSVSQLQRLASDPEGLARELARPMPRPPSPSARRGTRFHAWVESLFDQRPLLEPDDLPGAADEMIEGEDELAALREAFLHTPYAERPPLRVEAPFRLVLGGRVIRGRIDAVYENGDGYEVVDWKTNRQPDADPLQLAVYRVAWAEIAGVPIERVDAAFLYVRTGQVIRPVPLPGREELTRLLSE